MLLLWACLGMLHAQGWRSHPAAELAVRLSDERHPVRVHGVVVDEPLERAISDTRHATSSKEMRQVCILSLRHVSIDEDAWEPIQGKLRVSIDQPRELLNYGDEILATGHWSLVTAPGNPGQYDWRAALARKQIHGLLRVRPYDGVVVVRRGQGNPALAAVFRLRRHWERLIRETCSPREAGLLVSLLLGQRSAMDPDLKRAFVETGTVHLLVISGFHVGLIALLIELCLRLLGLRWGLRLIVSAICLGGYCLLTGLHPPVARATLMAWIVLGACALDRVISWPNTLAAAALVILWINPAQLFDAGFQLSFGAVISLLTFSPGWAAWASTHFLKFRPGWLRRYVAVSLSVTSAIWVGLAPVLAWYFYLTAPISVAANLLVAPLVSLLVFLGTILLLLGSVTEPVIAWGSGVLTLLVHATIACVSWFHAVPGGHWPVARPWPLLLLGYYGLLGLSVFRRRLNLSRTRLLGCWAAGLVLAVCAAALIQWRESRWLRVDVLDVGHGDSIVVRTGTQTIVVDAGNEQAGRFRVVPFLRAAGVTAIDALVITHPDGDHAGGAAPLLQELPVRRLFTNGARDDTMAARRVHRLAAARGIPETVLTAGMTLPGDGGVSLDVVHPPRGLVPGTTAGSNDNSVVIRLTKGSVSILLTGDIEEAGLPWLLDADGGRRVSVLKVPHHGSRLGRIGERFFHAVRPALAVLSVGRAHRLPAPETVGALGRTGAILYSTRDDGAVRLRTDGRRLQVRTFKSQSTQTLEW